MPNGLYGGVRGVRIYAFGPLLDWVFLVACEILLIERFKYRGKYSLKLEKVDTYQ